jgi:hypothetical protein
MVEYTDHARLRMRQRMISEEEVEYCLAHYNVSYTDSKGNPIYRAEVPGGRLIKVVVKAGSSNPAVVITVAD